MVLGCWTVRGEGRLSFVKELLPDIDRWRARGEKVAMARVVATRRTSPRPVGSKLAVSESGELAGSVSGGCVEGDVVLAAQDVLAGGMPRLLPYGITDARGRERGVPQTAPPTTWRSRSACPAAARSTSSSSRCNEPA